MKRILIALCALSALCASGAAKWVNLNDKAHLGGAKITDKDLLGKAVVVYYFNAAEERSVQYLEEIEKVWSSFKNKKFILIGNYIGAKDEAKIKSLISKNKLSFPVYYKATLSPDPKPGHSKAPYVCVVNHRGTVVYNGGSIKQMQEKMVDAIGAIGMPVSLCGDVTFKKFKGLAGQLKLGNNLMAVTKKLEKASKGKDPNVSAEAQEILSAIEIGKDAIKGDIEMYKEVDPSEALNLVQLFMKSWPKDEAAKEYKESLADLKKAVKERAKAEKAKGK